VEVVGAILKIMKKENLEEEEIICVVEVHH